MSIFVNYIIWLILSKKIHNFKNLLLITIDIILFLCYDGTR